MSNLLINRNRSRVPSFWDSRHPVNVLDDIFQLPLRFNNLMSNWEQNINLQEQDGQRIVEFAVPGFREEEITIEYNAQTGMLSVVAERQSEDGDNRSQRRTESSVFVGTDLKSEHFQAQTDLGLLTVTIPISETESSPTRKIPIRNGNDN